MGATVRRRLRLWTLSGLLPVAASLLAPQTASAVSDNIGFSRLTYFCPTPTQVSFSWTPAINAVSYSLQIVGPLDPSLNGGVKGTYLEQFGTEELSNSPATTATVTLSPSDLPRPTTVQWEVMASGQHGYTGWVPSSKRPPSRSPAPRPDR